MLADKNKNTRTPTYLQIADGTSLRPMKHDTYVIPWGRMYNGYSEQALSPAEIV